ncbi:MAG: ribonuclease PH [bacterium]
MREDKREDNQIRETKITTHYIEHNPASCLIEVGKTKVICSASIDDKIPPFLKDTGSGWLTAEYSLLPFSSKERVERERYKVKGRTSEIERLIGRSLRQALNLKLIPDRKIIIDCDVLQADGGTRCASITGGFCALYIAIEGLMKKNIIKANPILGFVSAISIGIVDGKAILDLTYNEDKRASCDLNLVMREDEKIIEIQGTGEGKPFSQDELNSLILLGKIGIKSLIGIQKMAIGQVSVN